MEQNGDILARAAPFQPSPFYPTMTHSDATRPVLPLAPSSNSAWRPLDVDNAFCLGSPPVQAQPARNDSNQPNLMDFFSMLSRGGQLTPELLHSPLLEPIARTDLHGSLSGLGPSIQRTSESARPQLSPPPSSQPSSPEQLLQSHRRKSSKGQHGGPRVAVRPPMPAAANQEATPPILEEDCEVITDIPAPKKARQQSNSGLGRFAKNIIESEQLSVLVASYHKHFGVYCKDKRKKVTQKVPYLVWRSIFQDFVAAFPGSTFQEESLKDRLRETLRELDTGTSNEPGAESAALQPDDVLEQIRGTNGHASRNVLKARAAVIDRRSPSLGSTDTSPTSAGGEQVGGEVQGANARGGSSTTQNKEKPKSKTELLAQQAEGICMMATSYVNGEATREAFMSAKTESARAKVDSEKFKGVFFGAKAKSVMINDLFRLKEMGVYTEEEFIVESRKIMDKFKTI